MTCRRAPRLAWLVAALLVACGNGQAFLSGDVCGAGASANEAVGNKFAACFAADPSFAAGTFSPCFDPGACEESIKSCNAADLAAMATVIACQNAYAASDDCSFAAITSYNTSCAGFVTTGDAGNALSPDCVAAFEKNQGICELDGG
jgi:hypothetical protein